jgi:hypothetical protein
MAWMATNLYVRSDAPAAVAGVLRELLGQPEQRADQEGLLDAPGPLIVSPALEGWVAVSGAGAWLRELPEAARTLSRACDTEAISCEIYGNCYRARLTTWTSGEEVLERLQEPRGDWSPEAAEPSSMPAYTDVEQLVYDRLRERGVPAPLAAIGTRPLGAPAERDLDPGEARTLTAAAEGVKEGAVTLRLPGFTGTDAPVLPVSISRDFGLMLFDERYVEGAPTPGALDRLIAVEEALLARARAVARAEEREAEITLTVSYHGGIHQQKLDAMLRERSRHTLPSDQRERPPWWAFWRYFGRVR